MPVLPVLRPGEIVGDPDIGPRGVMGEMTAPHFAQQVVIQRHDCTRRSSIALAIVKAWNLKKSPKPFVGWQMSFSG